MEAYTFVQDEAGLGPGLSKVLAYYIETKAWEKDFQRILAMVSNYSSCMEHIENIL